MCAKRSFGMAGSDGLRLKIAPVNTAVTLWVCFSPVRLCIIERLGAPVCISVHARRRAYTFMCVCVCASIPVCWELWALVLLNPAVTGSLFPAAACHRPRPSYVTAIHTNTQTSSTDHTHSHLWHIQFFGLQIKLTACVCFFRPAIHSRTDRHAQTDSVHLPGHVQAYPQSSWLRVSAAGLNLYRGLKWVQLIRINSWDWSLSPPEAATSSGHCQHEVVVQHVY